MDLLNKLYNEHRVAYKEIVSIGNSQDSVIALSTRIIKLYEEELFSHFKEEEEKVFPVKQDNTSKRLLGDHQLIYKLIDRIRDNPSQEDINSFVTIMKDHIKLEDKYFSSFNNKFTIEYIVIIILAIVVLYNIFK